MTIDEQIEAYYPLVKNIIWNNYNIFYKDDDCFQEGVIGVWEALETYDESKGTSIGTWIRKRITWRLSSFVKEQKIKLDNENRPIEIPVGTMKIDLGDDDSPDIKDEELVPFDDQIIEKEERLKELNRIRGYFNKISDRERKILEEIYDGKTYREIGEHLGISHERVRQIYNKLRRNYIRYEMNYGRQP